MPILDERRQEFLAKIVADIGKAIIAVALASYFFERYPLIFRWLLPVFAVMMLAVGVVIHPPARKDVSWK